MKSESTVSSMIDQPSAFGTSQGQERGPTQHLVRFAIQARKKGWESDRIGLLEASHSCSAPKSKSGRVYSHQLAVGLCSFLPHGFECTAFKSAERLKWSFCCGRDRGFVGGLALTWRFRSSTTLLLSNCATDGRSWGGATRGKCSRRHLSTRRRRSGCRDSQLVRPSLSSFKTNSTPTDARAVHTSTLCHGRRRRRCPVLLVESRCRRQHRFHRHLNLSQQSRLGRPSSCALILRHRSLPVLSNRSHNNVSSSSNQDSHPCRAPGLQSTRWCPSAAKHSSRKSVPGWAGCCRRAYLVL
jgi:hypothetical protein